MLFFAATRGGRSHLALYMSKGRIRLSVGNQKEIFNREKYNDGKWHSVSGVPFLLLLTSYSNTKENYGRKFSLYNYKHKGIQSASESETNHSLCFLSVGHIQFGEEEIQVSRWWDQSPGWSADKHWADLHAGVHVTCVSGQHPRGSSQTVKGEQKTKHQNWLFHTYSIQTQIHFL